jgi:hypothetical protein
MEDSAYSKMKQLLTWNDANLRKKILAIVACSKHTRSLTFENL